MDESKVHLEAVGNSGSSLGAAGIGRDDDGLFVVGDVLLDVVLDEGLAVEVVYGDVEKPWYCGS